MSYINAHLQLDDSQMTKYEDFQNLRWRTAAIIKIVFGDSTNEQLFGGSGSQRSKSHDAEVRFGDLETIILDPFGRVGFLVLSNLITL